MTLFDTGNCREGLSEFGLAHRGVGEGTRLGLSISYDIVTQKHGDTIKVDSRLGEFTEFTIHLPR